MSGGQRDHVEAADERRENPGLFRAPRRIAREELPRQAAEAIAHDVVEQRAERRQRQERAPAAERRQQPIAEQLPQTTCDRRRFGCSRHAYSSRKPFRSQMDIMFSTKVLTNSSMPTAKIVRYSSVPGRRIAEADLDDVGRHGFDRHPRIERQPRLLTGGDRDNHRLADRARHGEDRPRPRCPRTPPARPRAAPSACRVAPSA